MVGTEGLRHGRSVVGGLLIDRMMRDHRLGDRHRRCTNGRVLFTYFQIHQCQMSIFVLNMRFCNRIRGIGFLQTVSVRINILLEDMLPRLSQPWGPVCNQSRNAASVEYTLHDI